MIILYENELMNLTNDDYKNIEMINCYVDETDTNKYLSLGTKFKKAKSVYINSRKRQFIKAYSNNKYYSSNSFPILNFGYSNYLSNNKKILVIGELSFCKLKCKNCLGCLNMEYLNNNSNIETLIINKIGSGGNIILNDLPLSLKHLRVGESTEIYNLTNLPFTLEKLELYDQKIIPQEKIKLPFGCSLILIEPIGNDEKQPLPSPVLQFDDLE